MVNEGWVLFEASDTFLSHPNRNNFLVILTGVFFASTISFVPGFLVTLVS